MITVRHNCFETNSSSTHAIAIFTEDQYKAWEDGELFTDWSGRKFYTTQEVIDKIGSDIIDDAGEINIEFAEDHEYYNCDSWYSDLEHDTTTYATPNGEKLIVECAYGYDG